MDVGVLQKKKIRNAGMDSLCLSLSCVLGFLILQLEKDAKRRKYNKIGYVCFLQCSCSSLWNLTAPLNKYLYPQIALHLFTILIIEDSPSENGYRFFWNE